MDLNDILRAGMAVEAKRQEIERLKSLRIRVTAAPRGDSGHAGGAKDRLADLTAAIVDLEGELVQVVVQESYLRQAFTEAALRVTSPTEYAVLRRRYLDGQSFSRIARDMHYSKAAISRIHERGRAKLEQVVAEERCNKSKQK